MLMIKTKLDELIALTSYEVYNYETKHDQERFRNLVKDIVENRAFPDHHAHASKESTIYLFRLYRSAFEYYYDEDEFCGLMFDLLDVISQEVKYGLKFALTNEEIVYVLKSTESKRNAWHLDD